MSPWLVRAEEVSRRLRPEPDLGPPVERFRVGMIQHDEAELPLLKFRSLQSNNFVGLSEPAGCQIYNVQGLSVTVTVLGRQKSITVAGVSLYPTVFSTECWSQGRAMYSYSIISVSL